MPHKQFFSKLVRYFHTLKYLKPIQLYGQVRVRLKKIKINNNAAPMARASHSSFTAPILKPAQPGAPNQFIFLNQEHNILRETIWTDKNIDKLWLYNLHYFDFLHIPDAQRHTDWQYHLMLRWIKENAPATGDGWEPYALSLRIVNWIKWILLNHSTENQLMHNLAIQIRVLYQKIEIHILGNHILANAKALIFAGLFFEGKEAESWLRKGLKLFNRELAEQILTDGGHFELSTMYHAIILEDLLDVINLFQAYGIPVPINWLETSKKMFYWLQNMCHSDQDIAFFNDATLGIAPSFSELNQYQKRLGMAIESSPNAPFTHLAASGYCRVQNNNSLLIADIAAVGASYQPGHAHADTLTFEFSLGRKRLIVNSGISSYNESAERARERGSDAHNTLTMNDQNSSEVWKSFRVARRAKVHHVKVQNVSNQTIITASHDGYKGLFKTIHTRTWMMTQEELTIRDQLQGRGKHKIKLSFHIHPGIKLEQKDGNCIIFYDSSTKPIAILQTNNFVKIVDSSYHPGFNLSVPNKKLIIAGVYALPMEFNVAIKWNV